MPELIKEHLDNLQIIKEQLNDLQTGNEPFNFFRTSFQGYWNGGITDTIPSIYVMEKPGSYNVEMDAPGLKKDDFNIEVGRNLITLSCETESFYRSFVIPDDADAGGIAASYNNGTLSLLIPKRQELQKHKIHKIQVV